MYSIYTIQYAWAAGRNETIERGIGIAIVAKKNNNNNGIHSVATVNRWNESDAGF